MWIIFLIFMPFLTALIYLIARGNGMAMRTQQAASQAQRATDTYIRSVAATSPADEIAKAKALLDSGAITAEEFAHLKAHALSQGGAAPAAGTGAPSAPTAPTAPPTPVV